MGIPGGIGGAAGLVEAGGGDGWDGDAAGGRDTGAVDAAATDREAAAGVGRADSGVGAARPLDGTCTTG